MESIFSSRIRAGKRRTYFFDVRETRGNDYYLTITESRKKFDDNGYERHKIFLYKEDFNKFIKALGDATDYVKTELMPDFDFDAFNHDSPEGYEGNAENNGEAVPVTVETISDTVVEVEAAEPLIAVKIEDTPAPPVTNTSAAEEVDKW
jgi:Protein of unknown function (DUF3276)